MTWPVWTASASKGPHLRRVAAVICAWAITLFFTLSRSSSAEASTAGLMAGEDFGNMARQRVACDGGRHRATALMTNNHDQGHIQVVDCILHAADDMVVEHIACVADYDQVTETLVQKISAGRRESAQVSTIANGSCLPATSWRRDTDWSGCRARPPSNRALPAIRSSRDPYAREFFVGDSAAPVFTCGTARQSRAIKPKFNWFARLKVRRRMEVDFFGLG